MFLEEKEGTKGTFPTEIHRPLKLSFPLPLPLLVLVFLWNGKQSGSAAFPYLLTAFSALCKKSKHKLTVEKLTDLVQQPDK